MFILARMYKSLKKEKNHLSLLKIYFYQPTKKKHYSEGWNQEQSGFKGCLVVVDGV